MNKHIITHFAILLRMLFLLVILASAAYGQPSDSAAMEKFLGKELSLHPGSGIRDIYKLLYQGEFGVGHLISSRAMAEEFLRNEMAEMPRFAGEPLIESCSMDGEMVRVNLRPFLALNLPVDTLLEVIMQTADKIHGDKNRFGEQWLQIRRFIEKGVLAFTLTEFDEFTDTMKVNGYPAVHHSAQYNAKYKPAYRVVLKNVYDRCFLKAAEK
jgi:hypothetical protein